MDKDELERAFSIPRFSRYMAATGGDFHKAYDLYRLNLRSSGKLFMCIAIFEVSFRNAIDKHYTLRFGNKDLGEPSWLLSQSSPSGFLAKKGCEKSRASVLESIQKFGEYFSHDKVVSNLGFAFWRNLFNAREYAAGGDSLLKIFQDKPRGLGFNQTMVFNKLHVVNDTRNRIAHHDPICFVADTALVSFDTPQKAYEVMVELLCWMGFQGEKLLGGFDFITD